MKNINSRVYGCLWEQHRVGREWYYTRSAFDESDPTKSDEMFPRWRDRLFNVTEIVSDEFSHFWYNCARAGWDGYIWGDSYVARF